MANIYLAIIFFVILFAKKANLELIELNENNWRLMLKGEWMVEFFAPWCPACKSLSPVWQRFANNADGTGLNIAHVDVTKSPSLSGRFLVTALPTIYHVKEGEFRQYRNSRDGDAFMFYINQKEWQKSEPISQWKNPNSIHMSVLSYFFKLSHLLKDFNTSLQEGYGLPTWGSYALLATATIIVGAGLGLLLVCIVDFLYPAKLSQRQSFLLSEEKSGSAVDDEIVDDINYNNDESDEEDNEEENEEDEGSNESETEVKSDSCGELEDNKIDEAELDSDSNKNDKNKFSNIRRRNNPKETK
ncbi:thioredoxin-related transmembrane protein 1-like [Episyrphus balteatus]|uniref:thioredoxin-related transmembrane protein 1-like n=1 Tax=Episyrphus balteatus TaxID=286459 RepID=UPI0024856599|nr:thioredoxin-related transmembrane protein 1-like [Episyrphus balteatus]